MFEDVRAALGGVALEAAFIGGEERAAACEVCGPFVWVMAIAAGQAIDAERVMAVLCELAPRGEVAIEAGLGILARVQDCAGFAARVDVQTSGSVASLAADVEGIAAAGLEPCVIGGAELAHHFLVAVGAGGGADEVGARDTWRRHHGSGERAAGELEAGKPGCGKTGQQERMHPTR
jgi:hypothetical protein